MKVHDIMPFYFCTSKYRQEWKDEETNEDIASIFSEHVITKTRLKNARPILEEDDNSKTNGSEKLLAYVASSLGFNCCGIRGKDDQKEQ